MTGIINGAFERAGAVDELSLAVALIIAGKASMALCIGADIADFELVKAVNVNGNLVLNYKRQMIACLNNVYIQYRRKNGN